MTDCFGIPCQDAKDCIGTVISVFGIEIDNNHFVAQIPTKKQQKAKNTTKDALYKKSLTFHEAQSLTRFLSFGVQVICLGLVFMRKF